MRRDDVNRRRRVANNTPRSLGALQIRLPSIGAGLLDSDTLGGGNFGEECDSRIPFVIDAVNLTKSPTVLTLFLTLVSRSS